MTGFYMKCYTKLKWVKNQNPIIKQLDTQPAITSSKSTIKTKEHGVKYGAILVSLLLTLNMFHTLF